MAERVTLEWPREAVALLTMTNPEIRNHGSWEAIEQLAGGLREARQSGARVSVLASGVPGHWFEHAWLTDLRATIAGEPTSGDPASWFRAVRELTSQDVVSIAAISGDCSGGGAELGWACDLRVAEEQARFAQPEVMIGVPTGLGGTARLARLIGRSAAAELVLDGAAMGARRLQELGAVHRVVERGRALEAALAWASRLARRPPEPLAAIKRILFEADELPLGDALANEQRHFQEVANSPLAIERMREVQGRYDGGEAPEQIFEPPFDP